MRLKEVKQHLRESESLGPTHSTPGSPLFTAKWPSQPPKGPQWTEEMQEQRQKAGAGHSDPSQRGSSRAEGRLPAAHALGAKVLLRNSSLCLRQMYNTVALSSWQTGYYGGTLRHEAPSPGHRSSAFTWDSHSPSPAPCPFPWVPPGGHGAKWAHGTWWIPTDLYKHRRSRLLDRVDIPASSDCPGKAAHSKDLLQEDQQKVEVVLLTGWATVP